MVEFSNTPDLMVNFFLKKKNYKNNLSKIILLIFTRNNLVVQFYKKVYFWTSQFSPWH